MFKLYHIDDFGTWTPPSQDAAYPFSNVLQWDSLTKHWRSTAGATIATALCEWTTSVNIDGFAIVGANFNKVQAVLYDSTAYSTVLFDSGTWTLNADFRRQTIGSYGLYVADFEKCVFLETSLTDQTERKCFKLTFWNPISTVDQNYLRIRSLAPLVNTRKIPLNYTKAEVITESVTREVMKLSGTPDVYRQFNWRANRFVLSSQPTTARYTNEYYSAFVPSTGYNALVQKHASYSSATDNQYAYICRSVTPSWQITYQSGGIYEPGPVELKECV